NNYLQERLHPVIPAEEEISDHASETLFDIRRRMKRASLRVREQLDHMVRSAHYQKFLQEPIVTQRDGRYVVPVKQEFRGEIKGLVHDTSGSGATVFVEPMAVV
ncbi:MAG: endonuclease MutS2, partial [Clostridiales bacterium]|nr:endonuclease MutS2 [Clostridiales bacterium]